MKEIRIKELKLKLGFLCLLEAVFEILRYSMTCYFSQDKKHWLNSWKDTICELITGA